MDPAKKVDLTAPTRPSGEELAAANPEIWVQSLAWTVLSWARGSGVSSI
jgi:hypothetical protein